MHLIIFHADPILFVVLGYNCGEIGEMFLFHYHICFSVQR